MRKNQYNISKKGGFTLIEVITALGIISVLTVLLTWGISIFSSRRTDLILEQATHELATEMRVIQSKMLSIQEVDIEGEFTPKAAIIELEAGKEPNIYYLKPGEAGNECINADPKLSKSFPFKNRAVISLVTSSSPVYLIYTTPVGMFYVYDSVATSIGDVEFIDFVNQACEPFEYSDNPGNVNIDLTDPSGRKNSSIVINGKTGEIKIL